MTAPQLVAIVTLTIGLLASPLAAEIARAETLRLDPPVGSAIENATGDKRDLYSVAQLAGDAHAFVSDVTIPDGTVVNPGQSLTKTWRFKNTGSTSWSGYSLAFSSGDQMGAPASVSVPTTAPGAIVDVSVSITAPTEVGFHRGNWQMRTADGISFGGSVFVLIRVRGNRTLAQVETDLRDHSPSVREQAVLAITEFGSTTAPTLIEVLKNDADANVRGAALAALAGLADSNPPSKEAIQAMLAAVNDPDSLVKYFAVEILYALSDRPGPFTTPGSQRTPKYGPEVVPVLVAALTNSNPGVQSMAIQLLAALGPAAKEAIPALRELLARQPTNNLAQDTLRVIERH